MTEIPDFTDGAAFDDPWEAYRWLRDNDPVFWDERSQVWVISRHAELYAQEYAWDGSFETMVAEIGLAFLREFTGGAHRLAARAILAESDDEMPDIHRRSENDRHRPAAPRIGARHQGDERQAEKIGCVRKNGGEKSPALVMHVHRYMKQRAAQPEDREDLSRNAEQEPYEGRISGIDDSDGRR